MTNGLNNQFRRRGRLCGDNTKNNKEELSTTIRGRGKLRDSF
jgi:hypothetical protein